MLVLTDRLPEGQRIQKALSALGRCNLSDLAHARDAEKAPALVICDVGLETMAAVNTLREAIDVLGLPSSTPVICILRDPSHLSAAQARMAGATATLPLQTSPEEFRAQIHAVLAARRANVRPTTTTSTDLSGGTKAVTALLGDILKPNRDGVTITAGDLERTGDTLLSTVQHAGVQAWLELVRTHDDITYQHCLTVSGLTAAFAMELGLSPKAQNLLAQAALVHDIGKAQIPRDILNKAGKLTPSEATIMRTHPARGYTMLAKQPDIDRQVLHVVRHHHEFLDGSGYPDQLAGSKISRLVRIVTICDIFAAMIERRSYKEPTSADAAYAYLESLGDRLDGALLGAFKAVARHG